MQQYEPSSPEHQRAIRVALVLAVMSLTEALWQQHVEGDVPWTKWVRPLLPIGLCWMLLYDVRRRMPSVYWWISGLGLGLAIAVYVATLLR